MQVHHDGRLRLDASVVTVGGFDGVHLGHQQLVRAAVERAHSLGVPAVVFTFEPPPKIVFGRARLLTPIGEKLRRLALLEPDHVVLARFDADYAERSAEAFIGDLGRLAPQELWIGGDFRFGAGRRGDAVMLNRWFDVHTMPAVVCSAGQLISSTRIRALLEAGREAEAQPLHGWRCAVSENTWRRPDQELRQ